MVRELQPGHPGQRPPRPPERRLRDAGAVPAAAAGCERDGKRSSGRPARPSTAPGATTATTWTGSRPSCWCRCWSTPSPRAATCCSTSARPPAASSTRAPARPWPPSASGCGCHGRSIYGATASDLTPPPDCRYTQRGNRLYLHLFAWPFRHVHLDGLAGRVEYAQLLNDASEIKSLVIDPHQQAQNTTMGGQRTP